MVIHDHQLQLVFIHSIVR